MTESTYLVAYDLGTTGVKTCLFRIGAKLELCTSSYAGYSLRILPNGGAEQDPEEWWDAVTKTTRDILAKSALAPGTTRS